MKLIEKHREGSRWVRKHDRPQTAYQRLLALNALNTKACKQLREEFASLDPFDLHERLEKRLHPILSKAHKEDLKEAPVGAQ